MSYRLQQLLKNTHFATDYHTRVPQMPDTLPQAPYMLE